MNNNNIVYDGDDEDKAWCNPPCDALRIARKDGSMICSYCGREYLPDSVNKHKTKLKPDKSRYDNAGPLLVPMTGFGTYAKKKQPSVFDREDKAFESKSGRYFTEHEDY